MPELVKPDICVIGAGPGGLAAALGAVALRASVVLVEKDGMGGAGLHACIPANTLVAAARRAHAISTAAPFGVTTAPSEIDFARLRDRVRSVVAALAPNASKERITGLGVRVIEGAGRFDGRRTLVVGDGIRIRARRYIIATGSASARPPIPGLDTVPYSTPEMICDLAARPEHLIVIGASAIGLELAQAFRHFGSAVTVLDAATPLAGEDPECVAVVLDQLAREGIIVRSGVSIARVDAPHGQVELVLDGANAPIIASHLLVATGRRACVEGLGLAQARIKHTADGIIVDRALRTTNRRVYAIGDVIGGARSSHAASHHADIASRNALLRQTVQLDDDAIPRVIFTDPALAQTGLTEAEARHRDLPLRVLRWPYRENDRAQVDGEIHGHIKVVTEPDGRILGATIVGAGAGDLITTFTLAMSENINIRAFAGMLVPYPTLAEIGKRAAATYLTGSLTRPSLRRIMALLRRFS